MDAFVVCLSGRLELASGLCSQDMSFERQRVRPQDDPDSPGPATSVTSYGTEEAPHPSSDQLETTEDGPQMQEEEEQGTASSPDPQQLAVRHNVADGSRAAVLAFAHIHVRCMSCDCHVTFPAEPGVPGRALLVTGDVAYSGRAQSRCQKGEGPSCPCHHNEF